MSAELVLTPGVLQTKAPVGTETWAADLREATKAAFVKAEYSYVRLARLLHLVANTRIGNNPHGLPVFTLWGYKSFDEWAESDLKVHPRRARALKTIAECVDHHLATVPVDVRDGLYDLGWSKLKLLLRVLTPANAKLWLGAAKVSTVVSLEAMVQSAAANTDKALPVGGTVPMVPADPHIEAEMVEGGTPMGPGGEPLPPMPYSPPTQAKVLVRRFHLFEPQAAMVDTALARAAEVSRSDKTGYNLTVIAQAFLGDIAFGLPGESRTLFLQHLADALGLRIIAVDPKTGELQEDVSP